MNNVWRNLEDLPRKERRKIEQLLVRRHPDRGCLSSVIAILTIIFAIPLIIVAANLVYDLLEFQSVAEHELLAKLFALLLLSSLVGAGVYALTHGNRRSIRRKVYEYLSHPKCIWCEYDLSGHRHIKGNHITCPECGKDSPRIAKTSAEAGVA